MEQNPNISSTMIVLPNLEALLRVRDITLMTEAGVKEILQEWTRRRMGPPRRTDLSIEQVYIELVIREIKAATVPLHTLKTTGTSTCFSPAAITTPATTAISTTATDPNSTITTSTFEPERAPAGQRRTVNYTLLDRGSLVDQLEYRLRIDKWPWQQLHQALYPNRGQSGHPDNYQRHNNEPQCTPANFSGVPYPHDQPPQQQP